MPRCRPSPPCRKERGRDDDRDDPTGSVQPARRSVGCCRSGALAPDPSQRGRGRLPARPGLPGDLAGQRVRRRAGAVGHAGRIGPLQDRGPGPHERTGVPARRVRPPAPGSDRVARRRRGAGARYCARRDPRHPRPRHGVERHARRHRPYPRFPGRFDREHVLDGAAVLHPPAAQPGARASPPSASMRRKRRSATRGVVSPTGS